MSTSPATPSLDWVKPQRSDATVRLKNNALVFIGLCTITTLLPTPSPWAAILTVMLRRTVSDTAWVLSIFETIVIGILLTNITQSALALRYPPQRHAPVRAPRETKGLVPSPAPSPATRRLVSVDSKMASPAPQKSFSASTSVGPSHYAASPVSTPSRTLQYTMSPAQPPFDTSISSIADTSLSFSVPPTPSPATSSPLAAFRGMRPPSAGRPLDGSFFRRLEQDSPVFTQVDE